MKCILSGQIPPGLAVIDSFEVTLSTDGWRENKQTVSSAKFYSADSQNYIVGPTANSYSQYTMNGVRAESIPRDGQMVFSCSEQPTEELQVEVLKLEARSYG